MSEEQIIRVAGPNGSLLGILHLPNAERRATACLIMLNAGQLSRVGPQRLYVKAARRWADQGIAVLRLDMAGVGDSEAENPEIHFDNQSPAEVAAAVRYVRERLEPEAIFLQGLCAGARAAVKSGAADEHITGVLAWSCPIFSAGEGSPKSPYQTPGQTSDWSARDSVQRLLHSLRQLKFLNPTWWRNRVEYGAGELMELVRAAKHFVLGSKEVGNPFLDACDRCLQSGRNVLFVFGERDRMPLDEFKERFADVENGKTQSQAYWVIPKGTHTFTSYAAQEELIDVSGSWMLARGARRKDQ